MFCWGGRGASLDPPLEVDWHNYLINYYYSNLFFIIFQKLPRAPLLEHLSLQQNNVESLKGLEVLRKTGIQSLVLKGNPVELDPHYRQQ